MNAIVKKAQVTDVGIQGLDTLSEQEFFAVGEQLSHIEHGLQWAIGDWYNNIPWGDKTAACVRAGINFKQAQDHGRVAEKFNMPERSGILPFTIHRELAVDKLTLHNRRTLLQRAEDGGWKGPRLKKERDIILGIAAPAETKEYDNSVASLEASVVASLPKNTGKKVVNAVVSGLKKEAAKLKHEFSAAVDKTAEEKAKVARESMKKAQKRADEQFEKAVKLSAGVKAFLTKKEFLIIRGCLHPDYCSHPKATEAFNAFNKLADVKDW